MLRPQDDATRESKPADGIWAFAQHTPSGRRQGYGYSRNFVNDAGLPKAAGPALPPTVAGGHVT